MSVRQIAGAGNPRAPEPSLREWARQALDAEREDQARQRAAALERARRNMAGTLVLTCHEVLALELDPDLVTTELTGAPDAPTEIVASVVVESLRLLLRMRPADAASLSRPIAIMRPRVELVCPVCGVALAPEAGVSSLADLGRLLDQATLADCGGCGWEASA